MTPNEPEKRSRGPQPDGLFISASEALTWLAFGVPEKQAWRWHNVAERLRRRIGVQALWIDPYAVGRELASRVRSGEAGEHEKASLTILTEALKAHAARQTALRAAAARLMDALVRREFSAWGRKDKGFMQPDYGARRVEIPWGTSPRMA